MRSIGLACVVAGLAAVALAPLPARAADPDWKSANSAYDKARDAAVKAKARLDYALCAGSWAGWDDALYDGKVADEVMATLDPDLRIDGADEKVNLWRLWLGNDDRSLDLFDQHREDTVSKVDEALGGDRDALAAVMGTLGTCQVPQGK